jgi:thiol-disulfide isomerase/thioredoxin
MPLLLFVVIVVVAWLMQSNQLPSLFAPPQGTTAKTTTPSLAQLAVRPVSAETLKGMVPTWQGQPTLLVFASRFCHDCEKMKPEPTAVSKQYAKQVATITVDVGEQPTPTDRALVDAFQPMATPTLVAVDADFNVGQVEVGYQPTAKLTQVYTALAKTKASPELQKI